MLKSLFVITVSILMLMMNAPQSSAQDPSYLIYTDLHLDCTNGTYGYSMEVAQELGSWITWQSYSRWGGNEYNSGNTMPPLSLSLFTTITSSYPIPGFPTDFHLEEITWTYNADGSLGSISIIYYDCPSGVFWVKNSFGTEQTGDWHPGDSRIDPRPGDRVAIYCEPGDQIDVWGIDASGKGFRLVTFDADEVASAGPTGITLDTGDYGAVSLSIDEKGNSWLAWNGGVFNATGQGDFAKLFRCNG